MKYECRQPLYLEKSKLVDSVKEGQRLVTKLLTKQQRVSTKTSEEIQFFNNNNPFNCTKAMQQSQEQARTKKTHMWQPTEGAT